MPAPEATHCHGCGIRLPTYNRLTLPRKLTGDLVFCGYACMQRWTDGQLTTREEP